MGRNADAAMRAEGTEAADLDARLLGLEPLDDDRAVFRLTLAPHLCRPDGALFGGTALAASLAAMELATGRAALWSTVQFVASASAGEEIAVGVEVLAGGRYIDQLRITATTGDRLVFTAIGSAATRRADGIRGTGPSMPEVAPPDESPAMGSSRGWFSHSELGHHRVSEFRETTRLDGDERPGRMTIWARLTGETSNTAAKLGFLADMVPVAICRAAGVMGAGTSLDNSLRVGRLVDSEWVLLDQEGHVADGGYGHGLVHLWSPGGVLLGTGSQTAKLFSFDSFRSRGVGPEG